LPHVRRHYNITGVPQAQTTKIQLVCHTYGRHYNIICVPNVGGYYNTIIVVSHVGGYYNIIGVPHAQMTLK